MGAASGQTCRAVSPAFKRALGVLAILGLFVAGRGPLHRITYAQPVSNDDAILLLMARHLLQGEFATTLWNQPYNGALDAYLLAPGLLVGGHHAVFRGYQAVLAVLLVALAGLLARRLAGDPLAGWAAAGLAAFGTPYLALMAATGPPPNFLMPVLTGFPLLCALGRLDPGRRRLGPWALAALGVVCGLAVWNSSLAIPALAGMALGLALAGLRPRFSELSFLGGVVLGASPLLIARWVGASGSAVVTAASAVTAIRPRWLWWPGVLDLGRASAGLLGLQPPLVVDGPERASLPLALAALLALALFMAVTLGALSRRALPLVLWGGALAGAFALSRRTDGDQVRYLYGLAVPVLALAGTGLARVGRRRPWAALALSAFLLAGWGFGHRQVAAAWRDPSHATRVWQVPPLEPVLDTLDRAKVASAYASLQFAGRLGLESQGRLVASQAWNERIPGDPLRFRDEVDLDPKAAWVLSSRLSRGMPRSTGFRELLGAMGGSWREDLPGDFTVFRRFVPPYDESRPVPREALSVFTLDGRRLPAVVLDRDAGTVWTSAVGLSRGSGVAVRVEPPRRLSALVLGLDLAHSPLPVPWVLESDGVLVAQGPARHGLQWVNGAPRAGKQALLAIPHGDRLASELRLIFQDAGPRLAVSEVFAYGPDETAQPAAGAASAEQALRLARAGAWAQAASAYREAVRLEPDRAAYHACLARAQWRASGRGHLDVESLGDGGPALVLPR